ncbi:MAG TPA: 50S ribosomal protein L21 [Nitrospirota bacterium]|jgi:large subunit ribosomal protein L21
MYAVIKTGGKQYKVAPGDTLKVELLEAEKGATLTFSDVLLVEKDGDVTVGSPIVAGASVTAEVVTQGRAKKVLVFKHKRRKSYRKMNGHRQYFTEITVKEINA